MQIIRFSVSRYSETLRNFFDIESPSKISAATAHVVTEIKYCQECGDALRGRQDKKFCNDQCRVTYNNRLNSDENNYVRNVNNLIRRNRRILTHLSRSGKTKVSRTALYEKGFDFGFFTSTDNMKDGAICYYCYEQGYVAVEPELYLLVTKADLDS